MVETLKHIGNLLYSEPTENDPMTILSCQTKSSVNGIQHVSTLPDAIACQFSTFEKLVVVYGDHSLYVWDVRDVTKVSRCCVLVSRSSCIWDVNNIPCKNLHDSALGCVARESCRAVSFATCSADGPIRLWDLALQSDSETKNAGPEITMNQQPSCSPNTDQVGTIGIVSAGVFDQDTAESGVGAPGFRSMAVSSDGKYLAAGDCHGNLHVYNLYTSDYTCFQVICRKIGDPEIHQFNVWLAYSEAVGGSFPSLTWTGIGAPSILFILIYWIPLKCEMSRTSSCQFPSLEDPLLDGPGCGEGRETTLGDLPATDHILLRPHCGLGGEAINEEKGCISTAGQGSGEQLCSEASEIPVQTTKDDESNGRQHEDDDLFSQHFSNLSTLLKVGTLSFVFLVDIDGKANILTDHCNF
ncbi:uncharacterized protein LOC131243876 [Magnolia sinica]|uniref:uncharacterized protein LOC131243876 n=1 Tax=Magnolia sinica TaxID=86752 RepID=UPI0026590079|nr:uncharacterized protein LOC131243876 [Magnolia sinica]